MVSLQGVRTATTDADAIGTAGDATGIAVATDADSLAGGTAGIAGTPMGVGWLAHPCAGGGTAVDS